MSENNTFEVFKKIVNGRRSVRKFTSERVPENIMNDILDLALLAPNSSNLQPWQFIWINSPEYKVKMAEYCMSQGAARTASELVAVVARADFWKQGQKFNLDQAQNIILNQKDFINYYSKIVPLAYSSDAFGISKLIKTVMTFFIGFKKVTYRGPFGKSGNLLWATKTASLAAENIMLAAHAAGYDSCPMEGFDQVRVKKYLQLPCEAQVVMIIAIGKQDQGGVFGERLRGPREWFIKKI